MKTIAILIAVLFAFTACAEQAVLGAAPALNPDGRSVAYHEYAGPKGGFQVVVRNLEQAGHVRVIDSDVASTQLAWSPDGRTLAYVKLDSERRPVLWRVREERKQTVLPDVPEPFGVAFLDDQRVLAGLGGLLVIATEDGAVTTAVDLSEDLEVHFRSISVSRDGRVAFTCGSQSDEREAICVLDLKKPGVAPLRVTSGSDITPLWRGEDELIFSRAAEEWQRGTLTLRRHHLWSQNLRTGETRQLTFGDVIDTSPTAGRNGERLMSGRIELAAIKPTPQRREDDTTTAALDPDFETLDEVMRRSTIVTVGRH